MSAITYEQRRIRTIRSTWVILVVLLVLAALNAALFAAVAGSESVDEAGLATDGGATTSDTIALYSVLYGPLVLVPLALMAAMAFGGDYKFGVIRQTLTSFPQRAKVFWSKLFVVSLWIIGFAVLAWAVVVAVGSAFSGNLNDWEPFAVDSLAFLGRALLYVLGFCLLVFAVVAITRNQAMGLVVVLVWLLVVEGILLSVLSTRLAWLGDALPMSQGASFVSSFAIQPMLVLFGWVIALLLIAWALFARRDA
jgi:ABC-2 type transport system permease protein